MSLFLGKIHFWLFDKIKWFEALEKDTLDLAKSENIDINLWIEEANKEFGAKLKDEPLDQLIDQGNIHGWLQEAINAAEGRVAFYTTKLIDIDSENKKRLTNIYANKGKENALKYLSNNNELVKAEEIYNAINDYILEGMPCDRINQVNIIDDNNLQWTASRCLHKEFWNKVNGDVQNFYDLRNAWIETFVKTLNSNFHYVSKDGVMSIKK